METMTQNTELEVDIWVPFPTFGEAGRVDRQLKAPVFDDL